jgi:hypothetical protein
MDYSGRFRPVRPLLPQDAANHPVEPHPFFNESRYLHLIDGRQRIGGWFRIGQRANQGFSEMTVCLYLPDGRLGFVFAKPDDVSVGRIEAAGLSIEVLEPMVRTRLRYDGPIFVLPDGTALERPREAFVPEASRPARIDLQLRAVAPAHGGELLDDAGQPYDEGEGRYFARAHYDQSLRGEGTIEVGGQRWQIAGHGLADHSWGPRIWQAIPWYRWYPCTFGDDLSICLMVVKQADGALLQTGFLNEGGRLHHVHSIRVNSRYTDDERRYPTGFILSFEDDRGRRYDVEGETIASAPCRHGRKLDDGRTDKSRIMECMTRYRMDGREGWGMAEYMDHQDAADGGAFEGIRAGY